MAAKSQGFSVCFCWEPTGRTQQISFVVCHSPQIMVMSLLKSGNWHNWHERTNIAKDACLKAAHGNQKARDIKQEGKRLKGNGPGLTCIQLLRVCVCVCVCVCAHACVCSILFEDLRFKNRPVELLWKRMHIWKPMNANLGQEKYQKAWLLVCNIQRTDLL